GGAWYATKSREPMPLSPSERPKDVPAVVREYMNAGYYVTKGGEEVKSKRRFLRTLRGAYARKYQLKRKESPEFKGRVLAGAEDLPLYFIRREMALLKRESEGSDVLIKTDKIPTRLATHPFLDSVFIGNNVHFVDGEGLLMRRYAVGKAYKLKRPAGVEASEHWIHIDLSEQTLVAYAGDVPVFATLVSTGKEPGMTPVGVHRVQTKLVAASMRDQPQEDEAYSIDDVPWTQYFSGSVALHGAFWHAGFGQVRSHGCVNLSPSDARWLFGFTDPPLPPQWHAVAPTRGTPSGSAIVVTQ
ncbi:MAG: L,D-transpeptidase, partial [Nannocystaceae bacterium]|nr:L,D-transpeptidase [Nannocystaceae bacterium]